VHRAAPPRGGRATAAARHEHRLGPVGRRTPTRTEVAHQYRDAVISCAARTVHATNTVGVGVIAIGLLDCCYMPCFGVKLTLFLA
jgi:hypothetical protein